MKAWRHNCSADDLSYASQVYKQALQLLLQDKIENFKQFLRMPYCIKLHGDHGLIQISKIIFKARAVNE